MSYTLTKTHPRLWSLEAGRVMIVTDLHGDWDAYRRYRDRFLFLQTQGLADCLLLIGDLIHADDPHSDQSIEIVLDVIALRKTFGDAVIYLCGNHELPHIYGMSLARGEHAYTPDFEKTLTEANVRDQILPLFESLPFYIRTRAGVSITHAGAPSIIGEPAVAHKLFEWDHRAILEWANNVMAGEDIDHLRRGFVQRNNNVPYHLLADYFLAVSDKSDPRYNDLLRGYIAGNHPDFFTILWPALFTRNELEYGLSDYRIFLDTLLQALSHNYTPQHILVAGHMAVKHGYQIIAEQHLRLASATHSHPKEDGLYLVFDAARPVKHINELTRRFSSVFR
jgi:hypothetical protein